MRLLLAEDELELANALTAILKHNNYSVDAVDNGTDALDWALAGNYDGILLDIMMPQMNGLEVLAKLREKGISTPILMLTAKGEIEDRIEGLDHGADDYLTKPFAMGELLARIRAITRRKTEFAPNLLTVGNLKLDRTNYELSGEKGSIRLGNKEYQMMEMMMSSPNRLISTEQFMERIWGFDAEAEINVVWVYISYLRKKLTTLGSTVTIKASRGLGYTLEDSHG
ncbi:response regulator transcription factor [Desulfitobacterium chlororespirans]|uniref:Stage 0 sporulation protein A homolog n=1 Tax=Desulfitobacterium chlororespirans DSM 11544 TaxID=1121395 RepID=A0A1M7TY76_9FIRM|nr:response regulator transcription factor [Desulfitobacterium chlororespirans]SHN75668.1 two component transcriptional regulator, winged helix family [Desulfitobacterium chlororespirans DSM 11544]